MYLIPSCGRVGRLCVMDVLFSRAVCFHMPLPSMLWEEGEVISICFVCDKQSSFHLYCICLSYFDFATLYETQQYTLKNLPLIKFFSWIFPSRRFLTWEDLKWSSHTDVLSVPSEGSTYLKCQSSKVFIRLLIFSFGMQTHHHEIIPIYSSKYFLPLFSSLIATNCCYF